MARTAMEPTCDTRERRERQVQSGMRDEGVSIACTPPTDLPMMRQKNALEACIAQGSDDAIDTAHGMAQSVSVTSGMAENAESLQPIEIEQASALQAMEASRQMQAMNGACTKAQEATATILWQCSTSDEAIADETLGCVTVRSERSDNKRCDLRTSDVLNVDQQIGDAPDGDQQKGGAHESDQQASSVLNSDQQASDAHESDQQASNAHDGEQHASDAHDGDAISGDALDGNALDADALDREALNSDQGKSDAPNGGQLDGDAHESDTPRSEALDGELGDVATDASREGGVRAGRLQDDVPLLGDKGGGVELDGVPAGNMLAGGVPASEFDRRETIEISVTAAGESVPATFDSMAMAYDSMACGSRACSSMPMPDDIDSSMAIACGAMASATAHESMTIEPVLYGSMPSDLVTRQSMMSGCSSSDSELTSELTGDSASVEPMSVSDVMSRAEMVSTEMVSAEMVSTEMACGTSTARRAMSDPTVCEAMIQGSMARSSLCVDTHSSDACECVIDSASVGDALEGDDAGLYGGALSGSAFDSLIDMTSIEMASCAPTISTTAISATASSAMNSAMASSATVCSAMSCAMASVAMASDAMSCAMASIAMTSSAKASFVTDRHVMASYVTTNDAMTSDATVDAAIGHALF